MPGSLIMDTLPPCLFLILIILHTLWATEMAWRGEHRNFFMERVCCKRQSHFIYVGQAVSLQPINMDVGACRIHCTITSTDPVSPPLYEPQPSGNFKHTSMLEYLRSKKVRARDVTSAERPPEQVPSCGVDADCAPANVRVEHVLLLDGERQVEVVEECHCEPRPPRCIRVPSLKTFYFETPYESVLDVGKCSGSNGPIAGFSCVPAKLKSMQLEMPNRSEIIQTVASCELKESCYRVPHVEYYYEVVHTSGVKEEKVKEIDVGRCLGSCTAGKRCLLRSSPDTELCLLWAGGPASSCVPQGYESHTFRSQQGHVHTILAITSCLCRS
ncbi:uncharacterized protein LOC111847599 [Arapaima gigas]